MAFLKIQAHATILTRGVTDKPLPNRNRNRNRNLVTVTVTVTTTNKSYQLRMLSSLSNRISVGQLKEYTRNRKSNHDTP